MTQDFNAKRDLSPEDFNAFCRQYENDFKHCREWLKNSREAQRIADGSAQYWATRIRQLRRQAKAHEVELPE